MTVLHSAGWKARKPARSTSRDECVARITGAISQRYSTCFCGQFFVRAQPHFFQAKDIQIDARRTAAITHGLGSSTMPFGPIVKTR
jgi:hypothetical protein